MTPFIKKTDVQKRMGGKQDGLSWQFQRDVFAKLKRDTRQKRRRNDKQTLKNYE